MALRFVGMRRRLRPPSQRLCGGRAGSQDASRARAPGQTCLTPGSTRTKSCSPAVAWRSTKVRRGLGRTPFEPPRWRHTHTKMEQSGKYREMQLLTLTPEKRQERGRDHHHLSRIHLSLRARALKYLLLYIRHRPLGVRNTAVLHAIPACTSSACTCPC